MGTTTDAKLWYGLCWTADDEKYYENGIPNVVVEFMKAKDPDIEDSDDAERAIEKILKPFGCALMYHCYGDGSTMFGVGVTESYVCASRGYPRDLVEVPYLATGSSAWVAQLKNAAEAIGWPWKQPTWWLASYWG